MEYTLLLVEDDRDIREMLSTMLDMAGFGVVACDSAESGLYALREKDFDLVLTDYSLPRHSGTWLLQHAEAEGLLDDTPSLIVTAHPHVEDEDDYEVIRKPFDFDDLVARVRYRLEASKGDRARLSPVPKEGNHGDAGGGGGGGACPEPIELVLYVSSSSEKTDKALASIREVLTRFKAPRVTLTVHSLPPAAAGTVVESRQAPVVIRPKSIAARTLILGHITNPELLLELLEECDAP
jgi:CheY-like chemotaxis protein